MPETTATGNAARELLRHRLYRLIALAVGLPLIGTTGLLIIEGKCSEQHWSFLDALYMSVITITTVGFGEVHPLSDLGRVFVIVYLIGGLGMFSYTLVQVGEQAYRAKLREWLARRHMDTAIKLLSGHYIICGCGRMGRVVCHQLALKKRPFVVIDRSEEAVDEAKEEGWPWLVGDATDDQTLITAGIERAKGLATVLASDADNLYVVLSARLLARDLQIIARANDESTVPKLQKAGANRVVGLHDTGAARMTQLLLNPNLENFMGLFTSKGGELDLAEIRVSASDNFAGKTLDQTDFRQRGIIIVAVRRPNGELALPPAASTLLGAGDSLIAMGSAEAVSAMIEKKA